jgi:hypothetical protein
MIQLGLLPRVELKQAVDPAQKSVHPKRQIGGIMHLRLIGYVCVFCRQTTYGLAVFISGARAPVNQGD